MKIKSSYRLEESIFNKINKIAKEKGISNARVIELAVEKYTEEQSEQYGMIKNIIDEALDDRFKEVNNELKRLRVIGNIIDFHTQMHTEFWNQWLISSGFEKFIHTDEFKAIEMKQTESLLNNRIAHKRQKKIDWEQKRMIKE